MNEQNSYQKLVQEGYEEKGNISLDVNSLPTIEIQDVASQGKRETRHDKDIYFDKKRIGRMFFGYNQQQIQLKDGSYVDADSLMNAMKKALSTMDEGTVVVNKKGKYIDSPSLLATVVSTAGKITLKDAEKITNQDGRLVSVTGAKSNIEYRKGALFLGNRGIQLANGDYISKEDFLTALEDYIVMKKKKEDKPSYLPPKNPISNGSSGSSISKSPDSHKEPSKSVVARVIKKYTSKIPKGLLAMSIVLTLASGIKIKTDYDLNAPRSYGNQTEKEVDSQTLGYNVGVFAGQLTDDDILKIIQDLNLGDYLLTLENDTYNVNSVLDGAEKTIGEEFNQENKYSGDYEITGFSIVYNEQILSAIENFDQSSVSQNLGNMIDQVCHDYHLSPEVLDIRVHLGGNKDVTRLGWIDIQDLIGNQSMTQEYLEQKAQKAAMFSGTTENFEGDFLTISGNVQIKIRDEQGNLLTEGNRVMGSDGKEYIIHSLHLSDTTIDQKEDGVEILEDEEIHKKLTWNLEDCNLQVALLPALGTLAVAVEKYRKNKELAKDPQFYQFPNDDEYQNFLTEFEKAKEKYEQKSGWKEKVGRLFLEKNDALQKLDDDQQANLEETVRKAYEFLQRQNPSNFDSFSNKISFEDGKIFVTYENGKQQDITDAVMPYIREIGKDNKIVAEGRLEGMGEDIEDGIQRR